MKANTRTSGMMRPMRPLSIAFLVLAVVAAPAVAGPKGKAKKYHFTLHDVTPGDGVSGDVVDFVKPRVKAQVEKAFASHAQLVAALEGAPDPTTDAKGYNAFLKKKKIAGAYKVNVEIILSAEEVEALNKAFDKAKAWAQANQRPLLLGEFGAYDRGPIDSRERWTAAVARAAEARGWSWAYWQFDSDFILYDVKRDAWVDPILKALIPKSPAAHPTTRN